MKSILNRLPNKFIKVVLTGMTVLIILMAVTRMGLSLFRIDVNADAAYYLGVSRLILDGKIPFLDFPPGYTPLSFYIMAIPTALLGTSFTNALSFLYLLHLLNAFLVYKIARQYSIDKILALFSASLSLLLCLGADGCRYVLEPFVLFFGLFALFVLKNGGTKMIILSGFLCFCSFWSKQYGLGFICLAIATLFLKDGFKTAFIRKSLYLLMGFFLGMVVFVSFFLIQGVDPLSMLSLSGSGYERDGLSGLIGGWKSLLIVLPLLLLSIIILFANLKNWKKVPLLIVSFLAVLGFMLQCYVRFYAHYLMLVMPFAVLMLLASSIPLRSSKMHNAYVLLFALSAVIPLYVASKNVVYLAKDNPRDKQEICAESFRQYIPFGSENVYAAMDVLPIMQINSYSPPLIEEYGLSNGFVRESDEVVDLLESASFCMITDNDFRKTDKYTTEIIDYLNDHFEKIQIDGPRSNGVYYLYVRTK